MPHTKSEFGYPSVTEILGFRPTPWLDKWREKWGPLAERKTKAATAVGTAFHDGAERLARGEYVCATTRRLEAMLGQWEEWHLKCGFIAAIQELKVVSHKHGFEGTFDALGHDFVIYDWKTSSGIKPDARLQLAAYAIALEEQAKTERVQIGRIVHVSKDKPKHKLTVKSFAMDDSARAEFLERLEEFKSCQIRRKDSECSNGF